MPTAMPICRNVVLMPDAMPERCTSTTPTAVAARGGLTRPLPMPAMIRPGMRCVHDEFSSRPAIKNSPTPTMSRPGPMSQRSGTFSDSRPAIVALTIVQPDITSSRTPVCSAE
ncbi:Uncharacterised protein [Mycobacteroides abscessus subsp. abscessus]|nr:Uncharacterised protein [Mycobacteroides abscessus subsp. abscessus]